MILLTGSMVLMAQKPSRSDYTGLIREYRELIKAEMPKNNIVGLSIALVDKEGIIWAEGFGYENLKDSIKATEKTIYGIGSVTKLFTSAAIMQLAEKQQLDIDKPVTTYVPEFKIKSLDGRGGEITTRMIMTHHSGLPSDLFGLDSDRESYNNVVQYLNQQYTAFPPEYVRNYSNIGYCLLGYEIQKISHLNYADYIQSNIFRPLGMQHSLVTDAAFSLPNISKTFNEQKEQKDESYLNNIPAGGIYSDIKDMSLFIRSWLQDNSPLLKAETIHAIFTPQNTGLSFNLGSEYGIGWDLRRTKYNYIGEHGGATMYYRAQLALNRYAGLGVIILSNSSNAGSFTWRAAEIIEKACAIKGVKENNLPAFNPETVINKKINLSEFQGNYGQNMSWFPLVRKDSALIGKPGNDSLAFKLRPSGYFDLAVKQGNKWIDIPDQHFIFTELSGEKVFLAQAWGTWTIAAKMYPKQQITDKWKNRLGNYKVINFNKSSMFSKAEVAIAENTLYISAITPFSDQPMAMPFEIKSASIGSVLGTATYSGSKLEFQQEKGAETLYFMGLKLEKE